MAKARQCMEVIVSAKDRQAAEANRAAATLLQELEQEERLAETRRAAKERQKAKKKAKRAAKKEKATNKSVESTRVRSDRIGAEIKCSRSRPV